MGLENDDEDEDLKSADVSDRASAIANLQNSEALKEARSKIKPEQVQNEDGTWPEPDCVDCGEPNSEVRLKMGRMRCFECQTILEKKLKRNG